MKREKTGGREAGTPNRQTMEIQDRLDELNCDPIEGMAQIATLAKEENNLQLAGQMYKELAQYIAPKRRSIQVIPDRNGNSLNNLTDEELHQIINQTRQRLL